jgi:hypothetical protein
MAIIDNRTTNLNLPLPNAANKLNDDVARLVSAFNALDTAVAAKANSAGLATVATSGSYTDLTNKPTAFSGSYTDLTNKPTIPTVVSALTNDSGYQTAAQVSAAVSAGSASQKSVTIYKYVATAGQTAFSGVDANSKTMAYTAGNFIAVLNGAVLDASDYTATNGTTFTLASAAALNDELVLIVYSSFVVSAMLSTANAWTATQTFAGTAETKTAMAANAIDLSLGGYFSKTISGATTLTVSNVPASGKVGAFILELTNAGSAAITWFSGVKWTGGTAPTLTSAGIDVIGFYTTDGGTTWRGMVLSKDSK